MHISWLIYSNSIEIACLVIRERHLCFVFILGPDLDFWLGIRIGIFQKISVRLVRSSRISVYDALIKKKSLVLNYDRLYYVNCRN